MKRVASSDPEGAPQRSEKAVKENDAEPQLVQADPLLELLCTFTAEDKARRWKDVLDGRDVVSLEDLEGLAQDPGWEGFLNKLRNADQDVLASKLNSWRQGLGPREPSGGDSPGSSSSSPSKEVPGLFEQIMICNVNEVSALLEPPDGRQWLCGLAEGEPLFVRECYSWFYEEALRKMADQHVPKCPGLIYTGNPGIGKSSWLNYALVRFLQDGYAVVLERAKSGDHLVFRDGKCTRRKHRRPDLDDLPKDAVYLFDPDENDSHPLESNVFTVVATSPQEKHYKALKKRGGSRRYFPCWEQEELIACARETNEATVRSRFARWGGVPRYVFSRDQQQLEDDLQKAMTGMDLSLVVKYLQTPEISEADQRTISHMVVQYRIINDTFSRCELDFASPDIGRAVVHAKGASDYQELLQHYESVRRQRWQGAYLGHLWEHLCHKILPLGAKDGFKLEPLFADRKRHAKVLEKAVAVRQGGVDDMQSALEAGNYFQPSAPNFPVIDAAVKDGKAVYGFQMTVASSHPPKAREAAELLLRFPSLQLVWVVDGAKQDHIKTTQGFEDPAKKVDAATLENLEKVPQWLLKLQFPKENPFIK